MIKIILKDVSILGSVDLEYHMIVETYRQVMIVIGVDNCHFQVQS